jgi:hypothetical protein
MSHRCRKGYWLGLLGLTILLAPVSAAESKRATPDNKVADAYALAGRIDERIRAGWAAKGVQPAPLSNDAEFIRRVYLDLAGRIPSILEAHDFLDDDRPDKRRIWVEQLLDGEPSAPYSPYAVHFTDVWRAFLLSNLGSEERSALTPGLEGWLRPRLQANVTYQRLIRDILSPEVKDSQELSQSAFYSANDFKPENLAASSSRLFLGIKLECAQCHAHPFASWSRTQFWEFAAFFAEFGDEDRRNPTGRAIKIPGTQKIVEPRFLDGMQPTWQRGVPTQAILAEWLTSANNPYFARNAVNRMWAYFFGIGLQEPVDEPGEKNPPSHPELLEELTRQFVAHDFDLKFLIRAIVNSQTYQLSSAGRPKRHEDARLFARFALRGLTPEQLYDSLAEAIDFRSSFPIAGRNADGGRTSSPRDQFVARFATHDKRTEPKTSILQALFLMNGKLMAEATKLEGSKTLATIAECASYDTARRIEELYLVVLARKPRPAEAARLKKYVDQGGPHKEPKKALADVFWALLNSSEFVVNH